MSKYEVYDLVADESHGVFDTLSEARGCVAFDGLAGGYSIWRGHYEGEGDEREFITDLRVECCDPDENDPENIYGLASVAQSVAEDRR